ncbi:carbohydrate binding domain-containing protein [Verrucomicrobiota bacterium]
MKHRRAAAALAFCTILAATRPAGADLLYNGDFEYGFSGWGTGSWWGGEYLSTIVADPYAGEYAASLDCVTAGSKGAISARCPVVPGTQYTVSLWHKGPAGGVYVEGAHRAFAAAADWSLATVTFTAPDSEAFFQIQHLGASGTTLVLDHVLVQEGAYQDEPGPGEETTIPGSPANVTVEPFVTRINGTPIFPFGAYNCPSAQAALDAGFNCLIGISSYPRQGFLDDAHAAGLPVVGVGDLTGLLRSHLPEKAGEVAGLYANHPAVFAHYMIDEPDHDWWYVPPAEALTAHNSIRAADPHHPTMLLQMKWSMWYQQDRYNYSQSSDIFACDPYVIRFGEPIGYLKTDCMDEIRRYPANATKPVWLALEGGWDGGRTLTYDEQTAILYVSIANNVNGLFIFEYGFARARPAQWLAVTNAAAEVRHLQGALTSPLSTAPVRVNDVDRHSRECPGGLYIFAANTLNSARSDVRLEHARITSGATVSVLFENRSVTAHDGYLSDDFAGYARHVYVVDAVPWFCLQSPGDGAANIDPETEISVMAVDDGVGIDAATIAMHVNGIPVTPGITTDAQGGARVSYTPGSKFSGTVAVSVSARNNDGAPISSAWSFTVRAPAAPRDDDRDGMGDDWEVAHFGGTNVSNGALSEDWDNDGSCDLHEYRAGTIPTNAASRLQITGIESRDGDVVLRWDSASNRTYAVVACTDLRAGLCESVSSNIEATPPLNTCTDRVERPAPVFYRIGLED